MRLVLPFAFLALAALSGAEGTIVGYYGKTTADAAIYSAPSSKARFVARVGAGTGLIVNSVGGKWDAVIMANGRLQYVPAQTVALELNPQTGRPFGFTEAQVRRFMSAGRPTYVASRGGGVLRGTSGDRSYLADVAESLQGTTPYKWGGNEIGSGIDCSGFVKKMYGEVGIGLPRTAAEQATVGIPITRYEELQKGDRLYFWDAKKGKIGHTGIYLGNGRFVHSSSGHHGIATDYLTERWRRICYAARR